MTVDELLEALNQLHKEGYGKLNIVYHNDCATRKLSLVNTVDVLTDDDHIGKFVKLNSKEEYIWL